MKRVQKIFLQVSVLCLLGLLLSACYLAGYTKSPTPLVSPVSILTPLASQAPAIIPEPLPATPPPVATRDNEQKPGLSGEDFIIRFHPDGGLYVGDRVSVEVIPPAGFALQESQLTLRLGEDETLGTAGFEPFGIGGRQQATLTWVWDTAGLQAGEYTLTFSIPASGAQAQEINWNTTVTLLPASQVPSPEPEASWEKVESDCCIVFYISGTDSARDLEDLIEVAERAAQAASQQLGTDFTEKIPLTFLPRVIGHGGFASEDISVSYLDRDYAGGELEIVLQHEMIHLLDGRLGGKVRPSLLVEGLAVYLSGGHFKKEPLMPRAAALLASKDGCIEAVASEDVSACGLNWYIPLRELFNNFYFRQHEIGYLEAGALVEYMVQTWGWEAFNRFYRDIRPLTDARGNMIEAPPAQVVDAALKQHFGMSLQALEDEFIRALRRQKLTTAVIDDVRLTVAFYDTVRRYQQLLDPSAYFLYAWLPGNEAMRREGIVADYVRRPSTDQNVALEELLVRADRALRAGDYPLVQELLDRVNLSLDQLESQASGGFTAGR